MDGRLSGVGRKGVGEREVLSPGFPLGDKKDLELNRVGGCKKIVNVLDGKKNCSP